jgi:hypothetical protein
MGEEHLGGNTPNVGPPLDPTPSRFIVAPPDAREWLGYAVWGIGTLVVLIPEITAAAYQRVPWPTISATVGHLEYRWSWVALLVVAVVVSVTYQAVRYPVSSTGPLRELANDRRVGRSSGGRLTVFTSQTPEEEFGEQVEISTAWLVFAALVVAGGSTLTVIVSPGNKFILAYVLYGLIGLFFVILPSVLAFPFRRGVAFPSFFRTLYYLEQRLHFVAVLVAIGLAILLIHLALYPWPSIFHQLQRPVPNLP